MKQVLQSLKTGITEVTDVPCPRAGRGQLLIHTSRTLVSAGTERILVDFGRAGLIEKARQQPDMVRTASAMFTMDAILTRKPDHLKMPRPEAYGRLLRPNGKLEIISALCQFNKEV